MENCLVKKLKGVVNNDNLKEFGVIKFTLNGDGTSMQYSCLAGAKISCDKTFTVKQGATTFATNVYEYTFSNSGSYLLDDLYNGDSVFKYDKYKSINFLTWDANGKNDKSVVLDIGDLVYLKPSQTGFVSILLIKDYSECYGNLKVSDMENINTLQQFRIHNSPLLGDDFCVDINNLNAPELTKLDIFYSSAKCNVETLNAPKLTSMLICGCYNYIGDLKVWAERMWNNGNGRTSGTCALGYLESGQTPASVTWNGQTLYEASGVYYPVIHFHENEAPTLETT